MTIGQDLRIWPSRSHSIFEEAKDRGDVSSNLARRKKSNFLIDPLLRRTSGLSTAGQPLPALKICSRFKNLAILKQFCLGIRKPGTELLNQACAVQAIYRQPDSLTASATSRWPAQETWKPMIWSGDDGESHNSQGSSNLSRPEKQPESRRRTSSLSKAKQPLTAPKICSSHSVGSQGQNS